MTPQLRLVGLRKRFGEHDVVAGIDLDVMSGEFVALLGPSGCGKTTTLRMIAGLERADAGLIEIAGEVVVDRRRFVPAERRRVGLVFQEYALFPHMTVEENVAYGLPRGGTRRQTVADFLAMVGLGEMAERYPRELSGGQQQRVALARALAPTPALLLLDEPFSNLDPALRGQVRAEVRDILRQAGTTTVLVTHDQEEALSMADRVAAMFNGTLAQVAAPQALYDLPVSREVASFIGDAQFLPGTGNGKTIETVLGSLRTVEPVTGPASALVRPESIVVLPVDSPFGTPAHVDDSRFFGHDRLLTCRLTDGIRLDVRVIGARGPSPGDSVRLVVQGPVVTFPA
jgi:iron(III) transport system ATP-binding protein